MSEELASSEAAVSYPTADTSPMTVAEAARSLTDARHKFNAKSAESAEPEQATAEPELSTDEDSAAPVEATGDTEQSDPAEKPPLELPRSWTKDRSEHWAKLDPALQEFLLEQDRKASAEIRRSQNELAEDRKAAKAERDAAEQLRKQYEAKLPTLQQKIQTVGPFADIQSMADLKALQKNDPFRFQEYQVYLWEQQAEQVELQEAENRKAQEKQREVLDRRTKEHALLIERAPEYADAKKLKAAQDAAAELFRATGFTDKDLSAISDNPLLDDHRFQLIVAKALKFDEIQKAPKAVALKPVPPVQRPGTAQPANSSSASQIQALTKQLNTATGDKAARISAEIWRLERRKSG